MIDWITTSPPLMDIGEFTTFAEGLDHPECVTTSRSGTVYAGGEAGQIYRIGVDGTVEQLATTGGFILGLCLDGDDAIYACDSVAQSVVRIDANGRSEVYSDGTPDRTMRTPNHLVFDETGNLYVSDSGEWHGQNGCLFRIDRDGTTRVISDEVRAFPNGLAIHPDGSALYVVLSQLPGVVRLEIQTNGEVSAPAPVIELPRCVPDGVAFDVDGTLYVSCYAPDIVVRLTPEGECRLLVEDWEHTTLVSPTNLAFYGADRRTLVLANLGGWHLSMAPMAIPGAPLHYPRLR